MADAVEIGKVSVRIIPDTDGFREKAKALLEGIEDSLGNLKIDVEVSIPDAVREAEEAANAAQEAVDKKKLTLRINLDDQTDVKRGIDRLEQKLIDIGRTKIEVDVDEDALEAELANLRGVLRDIANIDIQFNPDSIDSLDRGIAKIDAELEKLREQTLNVNLDEESLERARAELLDLRRVQVRAEIEADNRSFAAMRELVEEQFKNLPVDLDINDAEERKVRSKIDKLFERQYQLRTEIQPNLSDREKAELQREIDDIDGEIAVTLEQLSKRKAQAELIALARTRQALIVPVVSKTAASKAAATLAALSGGRALSNIGQDLLDWVGGLDEAIPRMATMSLLVGNLGSAAITSTANLTSLAGSLVSIGQAGIALPGIFAGLAIGIGASVAVLKDFNDRLPQVAERLHDLQDIMSDKFWAVAEKPFARLADTIFPLLNKNLGETSTVLGKFFGSLAEAADEQFGPTLDGMFDGLNESIRVASGYTDDFVGVLTKLGKVGADNLPGLASFFGGIVEDFDGWLQRQGTQGLQKFVDTGVQALQDLGAVTRDFFGTFTAIAKVAEETGASTLGTLRQTMASVRETVESGSFQLALRQTFTGAREGLEEFTDAAGAPFQRFMKRLSRTFTSILPSIGRAGGGLFGALFDSLAQPALQRSVVKFFDSIEKAVGSITGSFPGLSDALAEIVDVVGTLAEGIGDTLGDALRFAGPAIEDLARKIDPLAEQLTELLDNIVQYAGPAFVALADGLGVVATVIGDLLAPINAMLNLLEKIPGLTEVTGALIAIGATVAAATWLGAGVRNKIAALGTQMTALGTSAFATSGRLAAAGTAMTGFAGAITAKRAALIGAGTAMTVVASQAGLTYTALGALVGSSLLPGIGTAVGVAVGAVADLASSTGRARKELNEMHNAFIELAEGGDIEGMTSQVSLLKDRLDSLMSARDGDFGDIFNGDLWQDTFNSILGREREFETVGKQLALSEQELANFETTLSKLGEGFGLIPAGEVLPADLRPEVLNAISPALEKMGISLRDLATSNSDLGTLLSDTASNFGATGGSLTDQIIAIVQSQDMLSTRTNAVREAFAGADAQMVSNATAAQNLRAAFDSLLNPAVGLIQTTDQFHAGLQNLKSSLSATTTAIFGQTEGARQNRAAIIGQAQNITALVAAQVEAGKSGDQVQRSFTRQRTALIEAAGAAGLSEKAVRRLLNQIGLTPEVVETKFREKGAKEVKDAAKGIKDTVEEAAVGSATAVEHKLNLKAPKPDFKAFLKAIDTSTAQAKGKALTGGQQVGYNLKAGVILGFSGTASALSSMASAAVSSAIASAKAAGDINSPSRETEYVGRMLSEGLVVGMEAGTAKVARVAADLTRAAIAGYAKIDRLTNSVLDRIGDKASKAFKKAHAGDIKRLRELSAEYDKAWAKLKDLLEQQKAYRQQVRDIITDSGNPTQFEIITPGGIISGLEDAVKRAQDFQKVIDQLVAKGLNKTTLRQIIDAGPEVGGAVAESILTAGVDRVNALQKQLERSASATAQTAGGYLFGGLIQQAQGDVDALIKKLKPLSDRLRQFAIDLVKALRDQLDKEFGKAAPRASTSTARLTTTRVSSSATSASWNDPVPSGSASSWGTFNYYAAPGPQLTAEEQLFGAVSRARM